MKKRFAILVLAFVTLLENSLSLADARHMPEDAALIIISVDEGPVLLGKPLRKMVGLMSIVNHGREDLCIQTDILVNELSPHVIINDDTRGLPYLPLAEGITRIGQGKTVSFNRVVAFRELGQRKGRRKVRATVPAWWCDRDVSVRLRSNIFSG